MNNNQLKPFERLKSSEKQLLKGFDRDYIRLPVNQQKQPLVSNGNTYNGNYYKEPRSINQLLNQYATYALRTGKRLGNGYYFLVLDLDKEYGGEGNTSTFNKGGEVIGKLGICWISTKRGGHLIILCKELPSNGILINKEGQRTGEIQSQGKYVVGLGSIHLSGARYNGERKKGAKGGGKFENLKAMTDFLVTKNIYCQFSKKR